MMSILPNLHRHCSTELTYQDIKDRVSDGILLGKEILSGVNHHHGIQCVWSKFLPGISLMPDALFSYF